MLLLAPFRHPNDFILEPRSKDPVSISEMENS